MSTPLTQCEHASFAQPDGHAAQSDGSHSCLAIHHRVEGDNESGRPDEAELATQRQATWHVDVSIGCGIICERL